MTATADLARRTPTRDDTVARAQLVGDRGFLERLVVRLKDSVVLDREALDRVFDDIATTFDEIPPTPEEVTVLAPRLFNALGQLGHLLKCRANGQPELAAVLDRASQALEEAVPADADAARARLRRLAMAAQDVLESLGGGVE